MSPKKEIEIGEKVDYSKVFDLILHSTAGNPNIGQIRTAIVDSIDLHKQKVKLYIISDQSKDVYVDYPGFMVSPDGKSGLWYGLQKGDIVLCGIGYGNQYIILNKISDSMNIMYANALRDNDIQSALFGDNSSSASDVIFDDLTAGTFILKSGNSNIKVSQDDGIFVGNLGAGSIYFDIDDRVEHRNNYSSLVSNQLFNITNSGYNLNGVVLRDMTTSATGDDENYNDPRLYKKWYSNLKQIGFDTTTMIALQTKGAIQRNPALIENREIVYEFSDDFYIESDMNEALKQTDVTRNGAKTQINNPLTSRRIRKEDCFSLSLISPNYLIEKIEGTAVDINGHIK